MTRDTGRSNGSITHRNRNQHIITAIAFITIVVAWLFGYFTSGVDVEPLLPQVLPGADHYKRQGGIFVGMANGQAIGYAAMASATGYGGPVQVLVGVDTAGEIVGVQIVDHKETPGFFRLLPGSNFLGQFLGSGFDNRFQIGEDIDGVSGATLSAEAVAMSVRQTMHKIAIDEFDTNFNPDPVSFKFGIPEITLISLFIVGFFAHRNHNSRLKKWIRYGTLITGMLVLGFMYNKPLTIANITSLLSGYWPNWRTNIYWYLLLGGILFVTTAQGKNPYCSWFCPFGAVQETLASFTNAKLYRPRRYHGILTWLQRGLAFAAIILGLAFRNPGAAGFEPFATLFDLSGSWPQWVLLILVLLASLIVLRPFCNYLCPLRPVVDYIGEIRRWSKEIWHQIRKPI